MNTSFFKKFRTVRIYAETEKNKNPFLKLDTEPGTVFQFDYEQHGDWKPISFLQPNTNNANQWEYFPNQFITGSEKGKIAAKIYTTYGYPIPIRMTISSAVLLKKNDHIFSTSTILRSSGVSFFTTPFPDEEILALEKILTKDKIKLLAVLSQKKFALWDPKQVSQAIEQQCITEKFRIQKQIFSSIPKTPTLINSQLSKFQDRFDLAKDPFFGLIKNHQYLPMTFSQYSTLHSLKSGERLPAFLLNHQGQFPVLVWYLRIANPQKYVNLNGIFRLEVSLCWYERFAKGSDFFNQLSAAVYQLYRQHHNLFLIGQQQLAEISEDLDELIFKFYRITGIDFT